MEFIVHFLIFSFIGELLYKCIHNVRYLILKSAHRCKSVMSRSRRSREPTDFSFLQKAGFKVHYLNGSSCRNMTRRPREEIYSEALEP
jgi:hypothetical protein